jgi:hypothetical protein
MHSGSSRRMALRAGLVAGIFAAGFMCGSVFQAPARAQMGDVMKKAGESGALGSAGELGSSIVEMQEHVTGLQKNIDTLKKIKAALGG